MPPALASLSRVMDEEAYSRGREALEALHARGVSVPIVSPFALFPPRAPGAGADPALPPKGTGGSEAGQQWLLSRIEAVQQAEERAAAAAAADRAAAQVQPPA